MTDSEQVPRGKGEKNRCERSEKHLKPCAYKVSELFGVMACLLLNESASQFLEPASALMGRMQSESEFEMSDSSRS